MPSHREPQQLPPSVAKNKKCEELLKGNRRNDEEINRRDPVSVVVQEGVCTENLNPDVLVMESAKDRAGIYDFGELNGARDRRIFVQ